MPLSTKNQKLNTPTTNGTLQKIAKKSKKTPISKQTMGNRRVILATIGNSNHGQKRAS